MFSCGIGPVHWKYNRKRAAKVIRKYVDSISLRDLASLQELEALQVTDVPTKVTADMAFLVSPASETAVAGFCREHDLEIDSDWMIIAPRPWEGTKQHLSDFVEAAEYGAKTYGLTPVFLAMEPGKDAAVCTELAAAVAQSVPCRLVVAPEDACLVMGLIRNARCVLGMRLHSLIFAAAGGVPFCGVAYDPKISGFIDYAGQGISCDINTADAQTLRHMIDHMMQAGDGYGSSAVQLRAKAEENASIAFDLIS